MTKITGIDHLYKYRSIDGDAAQWTREIIVDNQLYFPRRDDFNDPFDCAPVVDATASDKDFSARALATLERKRGPQPRHERRKSASIIRRAKVEMIGRYPTIVGDVLDMAGILSLSEKHDDVLMWSHYASSHRGICLRFRVSATQPYFAVAQPVLYRENRPIINPIQDEPSQILEGALLTKAAYWSYEREWRVIKPERPRSKHPFAANLLDGVILGARITEDGRRRVMGWLSESGSGAKVYQANFHPTKFALSITEVGG